MTKETYVSPGSRLRHRSGDDYLVAAHPKFKENAHRYYLVCLRTGMYWSSDSSPMIGDKILVSNLVSI